MTSSIFLQRAIAVEIALVILVFLIVGHASAVSISPVRWNESVNAGDTATFAITLMNTTPDETNILSPTITGDCAEWVSSDGKDTSLPSTTHFTIKVPKTATNGSHRCDVSFKFPGSSLIAYAIGFPITVKVSGGTEPMPTTAETTTIPTTQDTPIPSPSTIPATPKTTYASLNAALVVLAGIAVIVWRRR
jgi:hypothetical protein